MAGSAPEAMGTDSQGRVVARPLSPFMIPTAYRPQITSVLSIGNRISGVVLAAGVVFGVWWLVAAASSEAAYAEVRGFTLSVPGLALLFGWTLALVFHTLGSIRHLLWDMGWGFELRVVRATGWASVIGTVVLTAAIWAAGFLAFG